MINIFKSVFTLLLLSATFMIKAQSLNYKLSFESAAEHYINVQISVPSTETESIIFKMPVWTPGSYKVREFASNIDFINAEDIDGQALPINKVDKNTWEITVTKGKTTQINYKVYAFEISVRQSYVDQFYAFIHGVSVFGFVKGFEELEHTVEFKQPKDWKDVEVALPINNNGQYVCSNYDLLGDSPFALGNFESTSFDVKGVPHKVVMIGEGNYDLTRINSDFKKICETAELIVGDMPCDQYIHFIQNVPSGGGGLEHLNSQTSQFLRWNYTDESSYRKFLGLISHEYFHLWNVKRIRPLALGPFDYDKENYTKQLWVAEGITSYYDDLILYRCGIHPEEDYLNIIGGYITGVENQSGSKVMSLASSSFNAWIKAYFPNENSKNVTISYYSKGMLAAVLLDLKIISATQGKKHLDDLMQLLYTTYYKDKNRGFTEEEFIAAASEVAGSDLTPFFNTTIYSTETPDYTATFKLAGYELETQPSYPGKSWSGSDASWSDGKLMVNYVEHGSPAAKSGLSVHDEILSINGYRTQGDWNEMQNRFKPGDTVELIISRQGKIFTLSVTFTNNPHTSYKLVKMEKLTDSQKDVLNKWLSK